MYRYGSGKKRLPKESQPTHSIPSPPRITMGDAVIKGKETRVGRSSKVVKQKLLGCIVLYVVLVCMRTGG